MRALIQVGDRPRWAKAYSRAYRLFLLAFIPIGSLSPYGMRLMNAYGVRALIADLVLSGAMLLPFIGIFLWSFLGERFWDRVITRFGTIRFALEWAISIFMVEALIFACVNCAFTVGSW